MTIPVAEGPSAEGDPSGRSDGPLADVLAPKPITRSAVIHHGMIWDLLREEADLGDAGIVTREFLHHPGAVTVCALDDQERVLLIRQYRHPVRMELWELPAGLLDVADEPPLQAAQRELAEEADLRARTWHLMADWLNSPGGSDEANRVFLARDISAVPDDELHTRTAEEQGLVPRWVPLEEARDAVLAGRINNPGSVIGVLAAWTSRELGWTTLRPADSPWPAHHAYR
jgi:ADP-ribose pyrophosphatase